MKADLTTRLRQRAALYREAFNEKDGIASARWPDKPFMIDAKLFEEAAAALQDPKRPMFYLVHREGMYGQGIVGIFTTDEKAQEAARAAADEEPDKWHEFTCYEVQSNMRMRLAYTRTRDPHVWVLRRKLKPGTEDQYENFIEATTPDANQA